MRTISIFLSAALALAVALPAAQARNSGHSSGRNSASGSQFHSLGTSRVSSIQNIHPTNFTNQTKTGQVGMSKSLGNKLVGNKGFDKGVNKGLSKNLVKTDYFKSFNKKWYPGKYWGWGFGFGWGGWWGYGGYDYCGYCPWCYSPCYNVCSCYYTPCEGRMTPQRSCPTTTRCRRPPAEPSASSIRPRPLHAWFRRERPGLLA